MSTTSQFSSEVAFSVGRYREKNIKFRIDSNVEDFDTQLAVVFARAKALLCFSVCLGSRIGHLGSENIGNLLAPELTVCFEFHERVVGRVQHLYGRMNLYR